jgi:hypothetical protein
MYRDASLSVCIFESLSEGRVGIIFRRDEKASLRDWVRCRSRMLAVIRCSPNAARIHQSNQIEKKKQKSSVSSFLPIST